jgi:hypothetical protein
MKSVQKCGVDWAEKGESSMVASVLIVMNFESRDIREILWRLEVSAFERRLTVMRTFIYHYVYYDILRSNDCAVR